jgi:cell division protein FtsL
MSGRTVKLRVVVSWIALMLVIVSLPLAKIWKQQAYARLSRELVQAGRERDRLATEVLVLETETRSLGQLSRLETFAREHLGLIDPGPPTVIQPQGQVLASARDGRDGKGGDGIQAAEFGFFRGLFR